MSSSEQLINLQQQDSTELDSNQAPADDFPALHYQLSAEESHHQATLQLKKAESKPIAFALKANLDFIKIKPDDVPLPSALVDFYANDFIHIKEKYNDDWWIGRLVKEGCSVGFVPSPRKLEVIFEKNVKLKKNKSGNASTIGLVNGDSGSVGNSLDQDVARPDSTIKNGKPIANGGMQTRRKKAFFRKQELFSPYDVVPIMRPVVLIGPAIKGYEVTDMMQKAIFDFIKRRFRDRVSILTVTTDISLAKRTTLNNPTKRAGLEKSSTKTCLAEVQREIERIFQVARSMHLIVLDADTVNHPSDILSTSLAPIIVALRIKSPKVLQRLIKSRSKSRSKNINIQMMAAEKLNQCPSDFFDVDISDSKLDEACQVLENFLESYWRAVHSADAILTTNNNNTKLFA